MSKEASNEEYMEIIIPAHEASIQDNLDMAATLKDDDPKKQALVLSSKMIIQDILKIQLFISSREMPNPEIEEQIKRVEEVHDQLQAEFDKLGVDLSKQIRACELHNLLGYLQEMTQVWQIQQFSSLAYN